MLAAHHDRDSFSCGADSLDKYLRTQAGQDVRRKANAVFIMVEPARPSIVLGYYTLCAMALPQGDVPLAALKHVPRYPLVSGTLIGRLAISQARHGEGLGTLLLADAVRRAYTNADVIGSSMLVVDAIDEHAAAFYEGNGFLRLPDSPRLILPMQTVGKIL